MYTKHEHSLILLLCFQPTRQLRLGYPLSPLLFLLVAKVCTNLSLKRKEWDVFKALRLVTLYFLLNFHLSMMSYYSQTGKKERQENYGQL